MALKRRRSAPPEPACRGSPATAPGRTAHPGSTASADSNPPTSSQTRAQSDPRKPSRHGGRRAETTQTDPHVDLSAGGTLSLRRRLLTDRSDCAARALQRCSGGDPCVFEYGRLARVAKKQKAPPEHWLNEPEEKHFLAATNYLSLLFADGDAASMVEKIRNAPAISREANDLLRASGRAAPSD